MTNNDIISPQKQRLLSLFTCFNVH